MKNSFGALPFLSMTLVLLMTLEPDRLPATKDSSMVVSNFLAQDEVFNEGASMPTISFSIVEGGLSVGTIDGGSNLDIDPLFLDATGPDGRQGTIDDDYRLSSESEAVDAGENSLIILDVFDADGDGDFFESMPIDHSGASRVAGLAGEEIVDLGAYEFDPGASVSVDPVPSANHQGHEIISVYPTPAALGFNVTVRASPQTVVRVSLHDILGRQVRTLYEGNWPHETKELYVSVAGLASGVYTVVLETNQSIRARQVVLVR